MSLKKPYLLIFILAAFTFSIYEFFRPHPMAKKSFAPQFNISQYSSHGVVDRIVDLKINTKVIQKDGKNVTEVVAFVSLPFDFAGQLQYKWTLGQNITLVEGALTGSSQDQFQREVPQQIKITVSGFDPSQLRHIGFEILGDKNGRRIFADGLISSQKENSFEDVVQHVEKIKAEKLGIQK